MVVAAAAAAVVLAGAFLPAEVSVHNQDVTDSPRLKTCCAVN